MSSRSQQPFPVLNEPEIHQLRRYKRAKAIPKLPNEAAERAFLGKHDSSEHLDWGKAQVPSFPNLKPSTKTISLRLPKHLLDAIKTAANARDVPYQSLIKVWLQEKVQRG